MLWSTVKILLLWWFLGVSSRWSWYPWLLGSVSPWESLSALEKERNRKGLYLANKVDDATWWFLQDQELFHTEGCVDRSIVVMQDPSCPCPGNFSFLMNFFDKMSQNFLVKVLVNCLPSGTNSRCTIPWWSKKVISITFTCEHCMRAFFGLSEDTLFHWRLLFCFWIILKDPWLVSCVTFSKNFSSAIICWRMSQHAFNCWAFYFSVKSLGIVLAHTFCITKVSTKMVQIVPLSIPTSWQWRELLRDGHCEPTAEPFRCWYQLWKCKTSLTLDHPPHPPYLPQIACAI